MEKFGIQCPENICRTCLCESADLKSLNTKVEGEHRTLLEILSFVLNLHIITREKLPGQVCKDCEDIICKASTFKRRCFEVETLLEQCDEDCLETDKKIEKTILKHENLLAASEISYKCAFQPSVTSLNHIAPIIDTDDKPMYSHAEYCTNQGDNILKEALSVSLIKEEDDTVTDNEINTETFDLPLMECDIYPIEYEKTTCYCGEVFVKKHLYKAHLKEKKCRRSVKDKAAYTCLVCSKLFENRRAYKQHERWHKKCLDTERFGKYQCSQCMRQFKSKSSIAKHLRLHEAKSGIKHVCQTCKREFKHKAHLDNHILSVHTREKGFTCTICSTNFSTQESLELHKDSHSVQKKHNCGVCKKAFGVLSSLTDHMRTHTGEKPFLCSICGKGFSQRTNMAQHVRRHQGLKAFRCEQCDYSFVSKGELTAHARKHTGAHPFRCDECFAGFTTSSSLVKHRRQHTGERPYPCDLCPMRFAASGTLKNHRRTHTGEKPFKCNYCEKAFVQRHDLISHIRCHTGERPYTCQCGQAFRKTSALKSHVKMHSKDMSLRDVTMHRDTTDINLLKDPTIKDETGKTDGRDNVETDRRVQETSMSCKDTFLAQTNAMIQRDVADAAAAVIQKETSVHVQRDTQRDVILRDTNFLLTGIGLNLAGNSPFNR